MIHQMRTLLLCAGLAALPAVHASVILTGSPAFGTLPATNCANTSFTPAVGVTSTPNGFSITGTVVIQLSGPVGTPCTVSWSAAVPVLITAGAFTEDGTIDASVTLPANAPFAQFTTRTTLQGVAPVLDTTLIIGNGQHLASFNQAGFVVPGPGGSFLTQQFTFTACPCPTGGTVAFHIPVSAGITDVPEPGSATLALFAAVLALMRKCRA